MAKASEMFLWISVDLKGLQTTANCQKSWFTLIHTKKRKGKKER